jgi:26S proteasome regulatory subunit N2
MKAAEDEVVKHGAALGLGVAGMASGSEGPSHLFLSNRCQVSLADATSSISCAEIYDILRETLFQDSAVAGEASGYAMGLVMLGSGSAKCFDEMVQYAHETQHEKIIRGLALGMAFLWYGKEEEADPFIARLAKDKVRSSTLLLALPLSLKRGAKLTFVVVVSTGTGRHPSVRCHVHDCACLRRHVQQHGRRAAVSALGFVLCRSPGQVPRIVQLLSESYNPHVRQGAAVALGVACAGTGLEVRETPRLDRGLPLSRVAAPADLPLGSLAGASLLCRRPSSCSSP